MFNLQVNDLKNDSNDFTTASYFSEKVSIV